MAPYDKELKDKIVKRMMPPENAVVSKLAKEYGITETTLYTWRKEAREQGCATPGDGKTSEQWSSNDKFLIVMETYTMNEEELSEYCRSKGLYKEQIASWRESCLNANVQTTTNARQMAVELREDKKRIKDLERELKRKEKALAEAAALLVLRKNAQAIWGDPEDE